MERLRYIAIGTAVVFALAAHGQQSAAGADASGVPASGAEQQVSGTQPYVPSVAQQMKVFTEKLDLSAAQQAKIKPIVQHLHDVMMKAVKDPSLTHEQRVAMVQPEHMKAHEEFEQILTDEQKEKLEAYMQGPHQEMHWNLGGSLSAQPQ